VLVVDTSAVLAALLGDDDAVRRRLADDGDLHAPHLIDVEFVHALRRLAHRGKVSADRVHDIRADFASLALVRYAHQPLSDRVWDLRENLTAYDAVFVALAEALEQPLVTCDSRLVNAPGHRATVELYDPHTQ
jgi:predicted nucleic acid-binding protein